MTECARTDRRTARARSWRQRVPGQCTEPQRARGGTTATGYVKARNTKADACARIYTFERKNTTYRYSTHVPTLVSMCSVSVCVPCATECKVPPPRLCAQQHGDHLGVATLAGHEQRRDAAVFCLGSRNYPPPRLRPAARIPHTSRAAWPSLGAGNSRESGVAPLPLVLGCSTSSPGAIRRTTSLNTCGRMVVLVLPLH